MGGKATKEQQDRWLEANKDLRPAICRFHRLRTFYGMMPEEYCELLEKQNNRCAICNRKFVGDIKPHLDHDHSSGWIRGILCNNCNHAIGHFEEDIERMEKAIEYLISNAVPTEFNIVEARDRCKKKVKTYSPEERERRRQFMLGNKWRSGFEPWNKGKPWSPEMKQKMSESGKKRFESEDQRLAASVAGIKGAAIRWGKHE